MQKNLVIDTNPYIRDPKTFAEAMCEHVETSSAIEGIDVKVTTYQENGIYKFKVNSK